MTATQDAVLGIWKFLFSDKSEVNGLLKSGSAINILVRSAVNDIMTLTKSDVIIFCGGAPRNE